MKSIQHNLEASTLELLIQDHLMCAVASLVRLNRIDADATIITYSIGDIEAIVRYRNDINCSDDATPRD